MKRTFGPIVIINPATAQSEARCYAQGFDCAFRIGNWCTHCDPSKVIPSLPHTPEFCAMREERLREADDQYAQDKAERKA